MTGGGRASAGPAPLAAEATAILRALLRDFSAWGRLRVVATWDDRDPAPTLPADEVVPIRASSYREDLAAVARRCGAALVVAPETGGELERTTRLMEAVDVLVVGSPSWAVAAAADKARCPDRLATAGVACPRTVLTTPRGAVEDARHVGYPLVMKPRFGAGCERVALAADEDELDAALTAFGRRDEREVVLQEYVRGEAVSVSLLASDDGVLPLGVNTQDVRPGVPFEYRGGAAGVDHPRGKGIVAAARVAVGALPGLRGHVGVDLVVAPDRCVVIEVNPRLTTSYVGLRRALRANLAELVWRAVVEGRLPRRLGTRGPAPITWRRRDD
ncbi:MAG: Carbamoyl-phosphate synthase large chain [Actinobacteria bacterium ADurb.BinA094]|nr:MAG: Carbamoyl-phosphate synthase large chain [Actinobacteria bacterium ADurb.BinA094]